MENKSQTVSRLVRGPSIGVNRKGTGILSAVGLTLYHAMEECLTAQLYRATKGGA